MPLINAKVRLRSAARFAVFTAALSFIAALAGDVLAQGGGGGAVGAPTFNVLRSMAGTSGKEANGHLIIDDPRTIFYLGQDHKIIGYFEWEGPSGPHKFQGIWKNGDGKITLISDFQYSAPGKQFSGYWTMLLSGAESPGLWTLEARIDGESAGQLSFQLLAGPGTVPPVTPAPPRQPLSTGDLYKRLAEVSVYIDKFDAKGRAVARGSGFYLADGRLVTSFQNIDGASRLRVVAPDGTSQEVAAVRSWDRWKDWAILNVSEPKVKGVPRAVLNSWKVGSICYFLQTSPGSGRVIADGTIVGQNTFPRAGERLNNAESPGQGAIGSPLTNEFGDVVGMVAGSLAPGTNLMGLDMLPPQPPAPGAVSYDRGGLAIPITLIPIVHGEEPATSLAEMTQRGQMVPPVSPEPKVIVAQFVLNLDKVRGMPTSSGQQFSHRDQKVWVYVNWNENLAFKGTAEMAVYDADNRALGESKPLKVSLHSGSLSASSWEIPIASLSPGIYRVDVSLGDEIAWRKFFRMID